MSKRLSCTIGLVRPIINFNKKQHQNNLFNLNDNWNVKKIKIFSLFVFIFLFEREIEWSLKLLPNIPSKTTINSSFKIEKINSSIETLSNQKKKNCIRFICANIEMNIIVKLSIMDEQIYNFIYQICLKLSRSLRGIEK